MFTNSQRVCAPKARVPPLVLLTRMARDPPTGVPVLLPVPIVADSPRLSTGLKVTMLALSKFASSFCSGLAVEVAIVPQVAVSIAQGR